MTRRKSFVEQERLGSIAAVEASKSKGRRCVMHRTLRFYALSLAEARKEAAKTGTVVSCRELVRWTSTDRNGRMTFMYEAVIYDPFPED